MRPRASSYISSSPSAAAVVQQSSSPLPRGVPLLVSDEALKLPLLTKCFGILLSLNEPHHTQQQLEEAHPRKSDESAQEQQRAPSNRLSLAHTLHAVLAVDPGARRRPLEELQAFLVTELTEECEDANRSRTPQHARRTKFEAAAEFDRRQHERSVDLTAFVVLFDDRAVLQNADAHVAELVQLLRAHDEQQVGQLRAEGSERRRLAADEAEARRGFTGLQRRDAHGIRLRAKLHVERETQRRIASVASVGDFAKRDQEKLEELRAEKTAAKAHQSQLVSSRVGLEGALTDATDAAFVAHDQLSVLADWGQTGLQLAATSIVGELEALKHHCAGRTTLLDERLDALEGLMRRAGQAAVLASIGAHGRQGHQALVRSFRQSEGATTTSSSLSVDQLRLTEDEARAAQRAAVDEDEVAAIMALNDPANFPPQPLPQQVDVQPPPEVSPPQEAETHHKKRTNTVVGDGQGSDKHLSVRCRALFDLITGGGGAASSISNPRAGAIRWLGLRQFDSFLTVAQLRGSAALVSSVRLTFDSYVDKRRPACDGELSVADGGRDNDVVGAGAMSPEAFERFLTDAAVLHFGRTGWGSSDAYLLDHFLADAVEPRFHFLHLPSAAAAASATEVKQQQQVMGANDSGVSARRAEVVGDHKQEEVVPGVYSPCATLFSLLRCAHATLVDAISRVPGPPQQQQMDARTVRGCIADMCDHYVREGVGYSGAMRASTHAQFGLSAANMRRFLLLPDREEEARTPIMRVKPSVVEGERKLTAPTGTTSSSFADDDCSFGCFLEELLTAAEKSPCASVDAAGALLSLDGFVDVPRHVITQHLVMSITRVACATFDARIETSNPLPGSGMLPASTSNYFYESLDLTTEAAYRLVWAVLPGDDRQRQVDAAPVPLPLLLAAVADMCADGHPIRFVATPPRLEDVLRAWIPSLTSVRV